MLDMGLSIPVLNKDWAKKHQIPILRQAKPRPVENFADKIEPEIGTYYCHEQNHEPLHVGRVILYDLLLSVSISFL